MDLEIFDVGTSLFEGNTQEVGAAAVQKVMGGFAASPQDFPHQAILMVPLKEGGRSYCGASIIHPLLLLTAAHCFHEGLDPKSIRAAPAAQVNAGFFSPSVNSLVVSSVIVHPKFNKSIYLDNDIALVTLESWIKFDTNNGPNRIKILMSDQELPPESATVSGWGGTVTAMFVNHLRYAEVPFVNSQTCKENWSRADEKHRLVVTKNMICAGNNTRDACGGDSGGPLTCSVAGEDFLCGIVSYGTKCDWKHKKNSNPGIYTDVRKYYGWIRKHMQIYWRYYWNLRYGEPLKDRAGNKSCGKGNFECEGIRRCIPESFRCDGELDCAPWDTSDETNCTEIQCAEGRIPCGNGTRCILQTYRCDLDNDCGDASDERDCPSA